MTKFMEKSRYLVIIAVFGLLVTALDLAPVGRQTLVV